MSNMDPHIYYITVKKLKHMSVRQFYYDFPGTLSEVITNTRMNCMESVRICPMGVNMIVISAVDVSGQILLALHLLEVEYEHFSFVGSGKYLDSFEAQVGIKSQRKAIWYRKGMAAERARLRSISAQSRVEQLRKNKEGGYCIPV
jgi:hypothetical protein